MNYTSTFLETQNVEHVSAWDGSIVYNKEFGIRDWGMGGYAPSLAFSQYYFESWTNKKIQFLEFEWKRAPYGKVDYYYNEEGEIVVNAGPPNRMIEINYLDFVNGYNEKCCGE